MLKYSLIFFFILFFGGCTKKKEQPKNEITKPKMSVAKAHNKPKPLNKIALQELKDWTYYNAINNFIKRFENISPDETLSNALELKDLVKDLKENIVIEALNTSAFRARLNVLENEVLRLADMTYIPAISANEVNAQVDKIILVFGSLNAKINTVYDNKRFNNEIDLDSFFKLDSNEVDTNKIKSLPKYDD